MPHRYTPPNFAPSEPDRLVVLAFADELLAFALRDLLADLEEEGIIEIGDAVVATRNSKGTVRLHQSLPLVSGHATIGAFSGLLMGMLLLNPLFGLAAGAAAGVLSGTLGDIGVDDEFMKSLGETLTPGCSALFVVVRKTNPDELLARLAPFAGRCKILQSTMTAGNESQLRNLLEGALAREDSAPTPSTETKP